VHPRRAQRWVTHFGSWVDNFGASRLALELGVTRQAVYNWVAGRSRPLPDHAIEIISLSRGHISWNVIYGRTPESRPCGSTSTSTSLPSSCG
jgi:DNA-binding XRE family transcriptional regulator